MDRGGAPPGEGLSPRRADRFHTAWKALAENVPERLDSLIAEGMPPVVAAFPDCAMRIGGNQYAKSAGTGR